MERELMQQFITASLRFKKVDFGELSQECVHIGELVVMDTVYSNASRQCTKLDLADIQRRLHISKPAVSQILNSLERKGCIVRRIDPADRRKITVALAPKGYELLKTSEATYNRVLAEVVGRLGTENVRQLVQLLDQLAEVVDELKQQEPEE